MAISPRKRCYRVDREEKKEDWSWCWFMKKKESQYDRRGCEAWSRWLKGGSADVKGERERELRERVVNER